MKPEIDIEFQVDGKWRKPEEIIITRPIRDRRAGDRRKGDRRRGERRAE